MGYVDWGGGGDLECAEGLLRLCRYHENRWWARCRYPPPPALPRPLLGVGILLTTTVEESRIEPYLVAPSVAVLLRVVVVSRVYTVSPASADVRR